MRRLDLRPKASLHSSHSPPKKSCRDQLRIGDPPARQRLLLSQQIPPGILFGLSSSSKGIKDSNGHNGHIKLPASRGSRHVPRWLHVARSQLCGPARTNHHEYTDTGGARAHSTRRSGAAAMPPPASQMRTDTAARHAPRPSPSNDSNGVVEASELDRVWRHEARHRLFERWVRRHRQHAVAVGVRPREVDGRGGIALVDELALDVL